MQILQRARVALWTLEKITSLTTPEVRQLRANAERLQEDDIAALCEQVLGERPRGLAGPRAPAKKKRADGRRLVSRSLAFGMRGVTLANRFWSRSGLTAGGDVVIALWAEDVRRDGTGSSYLLWAPNLDGGRPWSDKPGGRERLEHCRHAFERGGAEGLLVFGTRLEGTLPDEKALTVEGADADSVLAISVEKRGAEYWATWGLKGAAAA